MAESTWVFDVVEREFAGVVERSSRLPVVLDFWAAWCQPCRILAPTLEKLADEYGGKFLLGKVNVDECPNLARQFQVSGIPMVVALVGGRVADHFVGVLSEPEIREFLDGVCPSEAEQLVEEATGLEQTDPAEARKRYEAALAKNPRESRAAAGLAELLLEEGQFDRAQELAASVGEGEPGWPRASNVRARLEFRARGAALGALEELIARVRANPKDAKATVELGIVQASRGRWEEALESLIAAAETDRKLGAEEVRPLAVKIFNIVGPQSEISNRYRARLASALY